MTNSIQSCAHRHPLSHFSREEAMLQDILLILKYSLHMGAVESQTIISL